MMKQGAFNKLEDILNGDNKIIIPDLQRDYCWGITESKDNKNSLAYNFTSELVIEAEKVLDYKEFSYGIVYTYQYPDTFLYLCDGQQRITTLYLIIGILNCYSKNERLEQLLQLKNMMPRLKYEVRNSTDYFIKNLVDKVFIKRETKYLNKISNANWFRNEYEHDPSVKSMIEATKSINLCLDGKDYTKITNFILDKIGFVYINLEANDQIKGKSNSKIREYGEKMYEIVNTCGNPMEVNEHQKSVILSKVHEYERKELTKRWEIWQDFFWINKGSQPSADEGFNEFLKWVEKIHIDEEITFVVIEKYFKAFFLIINLHDKLSEYRNFNIGNIKIDFLSTQKPKKVVLYPLLNYLFSADLVEFNNNQYFIKEDIVNLDVIFRFVRFFYNISKNSDAEVESLVLSRQLAYPQDICQLEFSDSEVYANLTVKNEEIFKLGLFRDSFNEANRLSLEDAIWLAEDHRYLNGKIMPFFKLIDIDVESANNDDFNLTSFNIVYQQFISIIDIELNIEKVRIALLAMSPNFWAFHDGGYSDWNRPRIYLGTSTDLTFWKSKVAGTTFLNLMKKLLNGELIENIIDSEIENNEDPINKLALLFLKDKAIENWQWIYHKRFFIDSENHISLLSGTRVTDNTIRIKLLNNTVSENL